MARYAIFGAAGAIGHALAPELDRRGTPVRVVGRSRQRLEEAFGALSHVEMFEADLSQPAQAAAAAQGIDTILYCVGLPYPSHRLHPVLMRTTLDAAKIAGVRRLVLISSVYGYGRPSTPRVSETHPRLPHTRKGRWRKEQEDLVLEAHASGALETLIVRLPDFYGPNADLGLANPIFRAALEGKTANWIGRADTPHEFVFVPDTGPVVAELAACDDCYGQAWNFGGPGVVSAAGFIAQIYGAAGREPRYRTAGRGLLTVLGLFSPLMRELPEMLYLQETPVILDDTKLVTRFGHLAKTSYEEGIRQTLDWMRRRR